MADKKTQNDEYSCIDCRFFDEANVSATYKKHFNKKIYSLYYFYKCKKLDFFLKTNEMMIPCIGKTCELFELSFKKIIEKILNGK